WCWGRAAQALISYHESQSITATATECPSAEEKNLTRHILDLITCSRMLVLGEEKWNYHHLVYTHLPAVCVCVCVCVCVRRGIIWKIKHDTKHASGC
ncbi:hypothetical protein PGIGA_G00025640, partial [Pangasianodon gigas]|nr:hypothetical protein [Pangasianodon gigas]